MDAQVISIYAFTKGYGRSVPVAKVAEYVEKLLQFIRSNHPGISQTIVDKKVLTDDVEISLRSALASYNQSLGYEVPKS